MAFFIKDTPIRLAAPVLASCVINIVAAPVLFAAGTLFGGVISLIIGFGTYLFVYRVLAPDPAVGRSGVALMAGFEVLFLIAMFTSHQQGLVFALIIAAAACLGFAYTQFGEIKKSEPTKGAW